MAAKILKGEANAADMEFEAIEENIISTLKTANAKFLIKAEHIDDVLNDDFFINIFTLPQCPSKTALIMKLNLMSKSDV